MTNTPKHNILDAMREVEGAAEKATPFRNGPRVVSLDRARLLVAPQGSTPGRLPR